MKLGFTVYPGLGATTIDFLGTVLTLIALVFLILSIRKEMDLLTGLALTAVLAAAGFALKKLAFRVNARKTSPDDEE